MHPVENDLRRPVPTGHHVARHLGIGAAGQAKVQDLRRERQEGRAVTAADEPSKHADGTKKIPPAERLRWRNDKRMAVWAPESGCNEMWRKQRLKTGSGRHGNI